MNLLLDTHAVIWFITDDLRLPRRTRILLEDADNSCFISIATLWEIAIKNSLGRLELHAELKEIFAIIDKTGFELLPITASHILTNAILPHHHHDPFDRIIIAQSIEENLLVVTKDEKFVNYEASIAWRR
ncbi:type II toxin-antitoxin system VapC family toxin [Dyadobacter fanqingshengii]|uniref:Type II toxin-antitoxin system VapC family toxin n=1 Tax=Dyadobacter fanqingshengii TaxID=2906443 RepID=A0A9X1T831_9BACT|nr:type II toxin-antitoxin system VapC family toxin [Dyadobacter fanqingshengii]MCF0039321.1 type II toxin-antitoxin system VapC family toxin [Dyadobacter fanqingshengii]MCF2503137.1 type II toxin-antitoxin system VapC family toxin [Dyadobacter fanqingshengii]USJ33863.1 type II toxin-antitoxin system VapC family toxin [Dyadobacter fanqingshengii]